MGEIRVRVPYLVTVRGRHYWQPGKAVRKLGFEPQALGTDPYLAAEKARELNAAVDAVRQGRPVGQADPRAVASLIAAYKRSPAYLNLRPVSQAYYDGIMRRIERVAGSDPVASITRAELHDVYSRARDETTLSIANAIMKCWGILLRAAVDMGWIAANPMMGFRLVREPSRGVLWTSQEVEAVCAALERLGWPVAALAVRLGLDTAQRPGDVLRLPWSAYDGRAITLRQSKTGQAVRIALSPEVAALLDKAPRKGPLIFTTEARGRAYTVRELERRVQAAKAAAGIRPELQFRDLRRTAATEAGAAGATDDEIRALTGHRNRSVVAVYVRPDDRMAKAAQDKRRAERERNKKV